MRIPDIPTEKEIRALPLGELIRMRNALLMLSMAPKPSVNPTTYGAILRDALAIRELILAKAEHEATLPPEPAWAAELAASAKPRRSIDDADVCARIRDLISVGLTDDEIWETIDIEYDIHDSEEPPREVQAKEDPRQAGGGYRPPLQNASSPAR